MKETLHEGRGHVIRACLLFGVSAIAGYLVVLGEGSRFRLVMTLLAGFVAAAFCGLSLGGVAFERMCRTVKANYAEYSQRLEAVHEQLRLAGDAGFGLGQEAARLRGQLELLAKENAAQDEEIARLRGGDVVTLINGAPVTGRRFARVAEDAGGH